MATTTWKKSQAYERQQVVASYIDQLVREVRRLVAGQDAPPVIKRRLKLRYALQPSERATLSRGVWSALAGSPYRDNTVEVSERLLRLHLVK